MNVHDNSRNLSSIELGLMAAIVIILFVYGMQKMYELEVLSERTGVEMIIRNMRANVDLWKSTVIINADYDQFLHMDGKNPIGIMFDAPIAYQGEYKKVDVRQLKKGSWAFETDSGDLIYRVINAKKFISKNSNEKLVRLRLRMKYRDIDNNHRFNIKIDRIEGISLEDKSEYRWELDKTD